MGSGVDSEPRDLQASPSMTIFFHRSEFQTALDYGKFTGSHLRSDVVFDGDEIFFARVAHRSELIA